MNDSDRKRKRSIRRDIFFEVNSANRNNPTTTSASSCTVKIGEYFNRVRELSLVELVVPNTLYNLTSYNYLLYVKETTGDLVFSAGLASQPGSYTIDEIVTALKTNLDAQSAISGNTLTYTVAYNENTMKLSISATGAFGIRTDAQSYPLIGGILNSGSESYGGNLYSASSSTWTENYNVVDVSGPKMLYFDIDQMDKTYYMSDSSGVGHRFTFAVPLTTTDTGTIYTFSKTKEELDVTSHTEQDVEKRLNGFNFNKLDVKVYDETSIENSVTSSLNGANWIMRFHGVIEE